MNIDFSTRDNFNETLENISEVHDMEFTLVGTDGKTPLSDSFFHNVYEAFHILDDDIVNKVKEAALKKLSRIVANYEEKLSRGYASSDYDISNLYDYLTGKFLIGGKSSRIDTNDCWEGDLPYGISMRIRIDCINKVIVISSLNYSLERPYYNGIPAFSSDSDEEPMTMELAHVNSHILGALSLIDAEIRCGENGFIKEEIYTIKMVAFYPGDTTPTVLDASFYDELDMRHALDNIEESVNDNKIIRITDDATGTTLMVQPQSLHSVGTYKAVKLVSLDGLWFDSYRVM